MRNNKGFSLVELIVVIAIMAILAAVSVVGYGVYVERAQQAADNQYLSDVVYRAELYAIENQVELDRVILAPVVDSPDDIQLVIKDSVTGEQTIIVADEIFESVGGNIFGDKFSNGMYDPNAPQVTPPNQDTGNSDSSHVHNIEVVEEIDPTCEHEGYIYSACKCGKSEVEILPIIDHPYKLTAQKENFSYYVCEMCGKIMIENANGSPIVPIG